MVNMEKFRPRKGEPEEEDYREKMDNCQHILDIESYVLSYL